MATIVQLPSNLGTTTSPRFVECDTASPRLDSLVMVRFELANRDNPIDKAISDLRTVVSAIQDARALTVSEDMGNLLARAVQAKGVPADIDTWANQLASEVCGLND